MGLLGTAEPAWACSCESRSDEAAIAHADAAFSGTLVETSITGDVVGSDHPERFVFDVRDVFKGEVRATQTVVTPVDGASCGLEISGPGLHLVFAFDSSQMTSGARAGELYSDLCSGTRPLAGGGLAVDVAPTPPIAAGNAPETSPPVTPAVLEAAAAVADEGGTPIWLLVAVGAGAAALVVAGVWWLSSLTSGRRAT